MAEEEKDKALQELRKRLLQHKEIEAKVKTLRDQVKASKTEYEKTEEDLKALQSVGQIIGEVLRQLDEERCKPLPCCLADECKHALEHAQLEADTSCLPMVPC